MKKFLVAIPINEKDLDLVKLNLEVSLKHGQIDHRAIMFHPSEMDSKMLSGTVDLGKKAFTSFKTFPVSISKREKEDRVVCRNRLWQNCARHVEAKEDVSSFFWWDSDAVPLKEGWLDEIWSSHQKSRKPFSGYHCLDDYMYGTAFWPKEITDQTQSSAALYVTNYPFDKVAASSTKNKVNKLNDNVKSFKKAYGDGLDLGTDKAAIERYVLRNPDVFLLIDAHDPDIRELILGRTPKKRDADDKYEFPSYNEQTQWETGMFAFPNVPSTCFFNPSVVELNGQVYLLPRRWKYNPEDPYGNEVGYGSDLVVWPVRSNMTLSNPPKVPALPKRYLGEQWEDPRATVYNGDVYIGFANWVYNTKWAIRQSFTRLDKNMDRVEVFAEPNYGGNASHHTLGTGHEKNWVWFNKNNQWNCVYSPDPQVVFRIDSTGAVKNEWKNDEKKLNWKYGRPIRGSTFPIQIGDEYLCFFHSATQWRGPKRRYHMGAYTFASKAPYDIIRMTVEPLLSGSDMDFRRMNSPLVIFPSGAIVQGDRFLVTFGVNDEHCGWIKIPIHDVLSRLSLVE